MVPERQTKMYTSVPYHCLLLDASILQCPEFLSIPALNPGTCGRPRLSLGSDGWIRLGRVDNPDLRAGYMMGDDRDDSKRVRWECPEVYAIYGHRSTFCPVSLCM